jgi:hypothetical protein
MNAKIIGFARWCRVQRIKHYPEKVAAGLRGTQAEDEQVAMIEAFCAKVRAGLDNATFEDKRRYFDLLDVRATLATENNERVAYVTCKLGKQRLSVAPTSPLLNIGAITTRNCECPSMIRFR